MALDIEATTQEVQDALTWLGLEREERDVLTALLRLGDCSAGDAARLANVSRQSTYKVLRSLVSAGLVQEVPTRPLVYRPRPLPTILRLYASMAEERAAGLRSLAERLPDSLEPEGRDVAKPDDVSLYSGRRAIYMELQRLIHQAQGSIRLCGNENLARRLAASSDLLLTLQQAQGRGVVVRILVPPGAGASLVRQALGPNSVIAFSDRIQRIIAWGLVDDNVVVILPQPDDTSALQGSDLGVKIQSKHIAEAVAVQLETMASLGTPGL